MSSENFPDFGDELIFDDSFIELVFARQKDIRSNDAFRDWVASGRQGERPIQMFDLHRTKRELIRNGMDFGQADDLANKAVDFCINQKEEADK